MDDNLGLDKDGAIVGGGSPMDEEEQEGLTKEWRLARETWLDGHCIACAVFDHDRLECHKHAPIVQRWEDDEDEGHWGMWPGVIPVEFCGDFEECDPDLELFVTIKPNGFVVACRDMVARIRGESNE